MMVPQTSNIHEGVRRGVSTLQELRLMGLVRCGWIYSFYALRATIRGNIYNVIFPF